MKLGLNLDGKSGLICNIPGRTVSQSYAASLVQLSTCLSTRHPACAQPLLITHAEHLVMDIRVT